MIRLPGNLSRYNNNKIYLHSYRIHIYSIFNHYLLITIFSLSWKNNLKYHIKCIMYEVLDSYCRYYIFSHNLTYIPYTQFKFPIFLIFFTYYNIFPSSEYSYIHILTYIYIYTNSRNIKYNILITFFPFSIQLGNIIRYYKYNYIILLIIINNY